MTENKDTFKKFLAMAIAAVAVTIFFGYHVSNVLFGDNSLEVYNSLKHKKGYLQSEIKRLQQHNAHLQKEYFELKNLEPEE